MKVQDYYTLKEIILGLRNEYRENERKLNLLKSYCFCGKNNISDFSFRVHKNQGANPDILCDYEIKKNIIAKVIEEKLSPFSNLLVAKLYHDNNNNYIIKTDSSSPIYVKAGYYQVFANIIDDILNTEFSSKINLPNIEFENEDICYSLDVSFSGIYLNYWAKEIYKGSLCYYALDDIIEIRNKKCELYLDDLLNLSILKENLSDYHIKKIDNSEHALKDVLMEDKSLNANYKINMENNQVILKRTKK